MNADEETVEAPFIVPGYVGKNKGILQVQISIAFIVSLEIILTESFFFQILFERGLYCIGMQGRQDDRVKEKLIVSGMTDKIRPDHLDAHAVLRGCPDFRFERTALQNVVESRGHILLP